MTVRYTNGAQLRCQSKIKCYRKSDMAYYLTTISI